MERRKMVKVVTQLDDHDFDDGAIPLPCLILLGGNSAEPLLQHRSPAEPFICDCTVGRQDSWHNLQ